MGGDRLRFIFNGSAPEDVFRCPRDALRGQILMLSLLVWGQWMCAAQSQHSASTPSGADGGVKQTASQPVADSGQAPSASPAERAAQGIAYAQAVYKLYFLHFACTIAVRSYCCVLEWRGG